MITPGCLIDTLRRGSVKFARFCKMYFDFGHYSALKNMHHNYWVHSKISTQTYGRNFDYQLIMTMKVTISIDKPLKVNKCNAWLA